MIVFLKEFFVKVSFEKKSADVKNKHKKICPACKDINDVLQVYHFQMGWPSLVYVLDEK